MTDIAENIDRLITDIPKTSWMRKHLTCGRCLVLDWATSKARDEPDFLHRLQRLHEGCGNHRESLKFTTTADDGQLVTLLDCYPQFAARLRLINAFLRSETELEPAIRDVVTATEEAWHHRTLDEIRSLEQKLAPEPPTSQDRGREPSFMTQIVLPRCQALLRKIAFESDIAVRNQPRFGWSHPGLQMAGEILAALSGDHREVKVTVRTKAMFAWPHATHPRGILAEITVQRLPNGCGLLLPDAFHCGYLNMDAGGQFAQGLQNALWAAHNYADMSLAGRGFCDFDWRWSINLLPVFAMHSELRDRIQMTISGRSAEVAFACALIAAHPDNPDNNGDIDPLDPHVGVTASIASLTKGTDKLKGVTSVDIKTVLGQMERRRLLEVVIAKGQDKTLIPTPKEDSRFAWPEAASVAEAYELMTRHPRLTRGVNRALARRAKNLLTEYCTPYVRPAIAEIIETKPGRGGDRRSQHDSETSAAAGMGTDLPALNPKPTRRRTLKKWEKRQLITGQLRPFPAVKHRDSIRGDETWYGNRVRIFADSGLGKSVFILQCEYAIAAADSGLLPLRLGRVTGNDAELGTIIWKAAKPDDVILGLADRLGWARDEYLLEAQDSKASARPRPRELDVSPEQLREWFAWMVKNGRVVFLLDALDQVRDGVPGLGSFLGGQMLLKCPVIMTGRPEALRGRSEAFEDNARWRTLELQPFDEPRQRKYLGEELADQLIPESSKIDFSATADEIRRHQWKDLLQVPLLLSLLKELSTGNSSRGRLQDLTSRYDLYRMAVEHLIDKGWNSLKAEQKTNLKSIEELQEILGQVAWAMVCRHDPTNIIEGRAFAELRKDYDLNEATLKALHQVDLITAFQVLDRADENGLAFRHRSFLEFFAGCHLMDLVRQTDRNSRKVIVIDRVPAGVRSDILKQIHETCDPQHRLLPHMLHETNHRPAIWHDTLRFALSHANEHRRNQLARELIELANPWVVYEALRRDGTAFSREVEHLCRWLVHRDWPDWFEYRNAVKEAESVGSANVQDIARSAVASGVIDVSSVTRRSTRDAAHLYPLRELLPDSAALYVAISEEAGLKERLTCLHSGDVTWNFLESFANLEGGTFDLSRYADHSDIRPQQRKIKSFELGDFPVTNELFELFCPTHRRHRDQYSNADDQPAVHVNWFMATEFCQWLSELTGQTYRLPGEWEWEWACRWRNTCHEVYWWGEEMEDGICWYTESSGDVGTRRRCETIAALQKSGRHHPSGMTGPGGMKGPELLDMLGNVWEWCANPYDPDADPDDPGSSRVLRGGSWRYDAGRCRSAPRDNGTPDYRGDDIGFRVVRE